MIDGKGRMKILDQRLPLLVGLLCVAQPLMDIAAYWNRELGISSAWTSALRLLLLLGSFCVGFLVSKRRRVYVVFSAVVLCYLAGHVAACLATAEGYLNWSEDLKDQIRTLVLPITALSVMSCLRADERVFPAMMKALCVNLGLILLVQVLSRLTGTDPYTYPTKSVGVRGWFLWPSPQSAILSVLSPLVIAWTLHRWPDRILPVTLASLVSFGMLYAFGTRLSYATVAGVGLGLAVCVFPGGKRRRIQAGAILLSAVLFLSLFPLSPMVLNRAAVEACDEVKRERFNAAAAVYLDADPSELKTTKNRDALLAAYRYNIQGMIDRFGLDQVAALYGYTLDSSVIYNDRTMKTNFCILLMRDISAQTPLARWFGVELERTRVHNTEVYDFLQDKWDIDTENFDPEQDAFGVLTLNGWVGFGLLAAFLLWFGLRALIAVWKERGRFTTIFAAFLGAYGLCILYAVSTASTLRRNNASIYFAFAAAGLWYLSVRPCPKGEAHD